MIEFELEFDWVVTVEVSPNKLHQTFVEKEVGGLICISKGVNPVQRNGLGPIVFMQIRCKFR